jgi:hypothetical protein
MADQGTTERQEAKHPERQALRRRLRQLGWNMGEQTKNAGRIRVPLWPAPHTGPAEGIEPRWVEGDNRDEVLRNAVRELREQRPPAEGEQPGTASE